MHTLTQLIHRRLMEAAGNDGAQSGSSGSGNPGAAGGDAGNAAGDAGNSAEIEQRARDMGWSPKEEWRGNPDSWIGAAEYVHRGEQMIPILRSNLRKSEGELAALRKQIQDQNARLAAATESIEVLTNISTEQSRNAAKEKRRELLRQRAEARRNDDTDAEIALEEQIEEVNAQISELEEEPAAAAPTAKGKKPAGKAAPAQEQPPVQDPTQDPDYIAWTRDNSWFGTDARRTALATAIGQEIRANPANAGLVGRPFFDRVTAEMNKFLGVQQRPGGSKVEGGGGNGSNGGGSGGGGGTPNGKSYNDLPQDAKDACTRNAKLLVGPDKAFKTLADWQKHYIYTYFNS